MSLIITQESLERIKYDFSRDIKKIRAKYKKILHNDEMKEIVLQCIEEDLRMVEDEE